MTRSPHSATVTIPVEQKDPRLSPWGSHASILSRTAGRSRRLLLALRCLQATRPSFRAYESSTRSRHLVGALLPMCHA
jgi:hypothetical protein